MIENVQYTENVNMYTALAVAIHSVLHKFLQSSQQPHEAGIIS